MNYLRVRGEYLGLTGSYCTLLELPPRARRILYDETQLREIMGTTSACAENTLKTLVGFTHDGNYLRVRGEYPIRPGQNPARQELPPRARRILFHHG